MGPDSSKEGGSVGREGARTVGRMTIRRCASTAATLLAGALVGLLAACGNGGPEGLIPRPGTLDFGEVVFRDVLERTLELENRTRRPLYVQAVTPNCGCLKVGPFNRSVEPGEVRRIRTVLDSRNLPDVPLKGKVLEIVTHPPEAGLVIPVRANIVGTHDFAPNFVELGTLDAAGRAARYRIELRPRPGVGMTVARVEATPPPLEARIERLEKGTDVVVGIRDGAPAGTGRLRGRLEIHVALTLPSGAQRTRIERVPVEGTWPGEGEG